MDRETRTLLKALVDGQVKLSEEVGRLAKVQAKLAKEQAKLAKEQARTATELRQVGKRVETEQARTSAELRHLGKRMDKYAAAVVRGFANRADRDHGLEKWVDAVEARLDALERRRS